jgi:V8-like Glu-specific endopeptidase
MNILDAIEQTTWRAGGKHTRRRGTEAFERSTKVWGTVERPERVLCRMEQLGMHQEALRLASSMARGERFVGFNPLERIIRENDLMSSFFLHLGATRARAVGRIVTRTDVGVGTGFLISPRLMMTNNHVIENERHAERSLVEFDYVRPFGRDIGTTQRFGLLPSEFFLTSVTRDGLNLDYTIVAVEAVNSNGHELAARGYVPLAAASGELTVKELANIIQHPGGHPQQVALRDNKVVESLKHFIRYEADTMPGSSGSPVFNDQWQLAALHHSGVPDEVRTGVYRLRDGGASGSCRCRRTSTGSRTRACASAASSPTRVRGSRATRHASRSSRRPYAERSRRSPRAYAGTEWGARSVTRRRRAR